MRLRHFQETLKRQSALPDPRWPLSAALMACLDVRDAVSDAEHTASASDCTAAAGAAEQRDTCEVRGLPKHPLAAVLEQRLALWAASGAVPVRFTHVPGFSETATTSDVLEHATPELVRLIAPFLYHCTTDSPSQAAGGCEADAAAAPALAEAASAEVVPSREVAMEAAAWKAEPTASASVAMEAYSQALRCVGGDFGVYMLLGLRRTAGSVPILPPPRAALLDSFEQPHRPGQVLTVGARALTKHCHRCSAGWWGANRGSEAAKNEWARGVVARLLDNCVWINSHMLPHEVPVLEVRVAEGYGARWLADGSQFRGFLEPQTAGGRELRWRH